MLMSVEGTRESLQKDVAFLLDSWCPFPKLLHCTRLPGAGLLQHYGQWSLEASSHRLWPLDTLIAVPLTAETPLHKNIPPAPCRVGFWQVQPMQQHTNISVTHWVVATPIPTHPRMGVASSSQGALLQPCGAWLFFYLSCLHSSAFSTFLLANPLLPQPHLN